MDMETLLHEAVIKSCGLESGPNGRGGMRVVVHFPNGGDEHALWTLINNARIFNTNNASSK